MPFLWHLTPRIIKLKVSLKRWRLPEVAQYLILLFTPLNKSWDSPQLHFVAMDLGLDLPKLINHFNYSNLERHFNFWTNLELPMTVFCSLWLPPDQSLLLVDMKALAQYLCKFVFNMSQVSLFFICPNKEAKLLTQA